MPDIDVNSITVDRLRNCLNDATDQVKVIVIANREEVVSQISRLGLWQSLYFGLTFVILSCLILISWTMPVYKPLPTVSEIKIPKLDHPQEDWVIQPCETCKGTGKVLYTNGVVYECPVCKGFKSLLQKPSNPGNPRE